MAGTIGTMLNSCLLIVVAGLPSLPILFAYLTYKRFLEQKRSLVLNMMRQDEPFRAYVKAYALGTDAGATGAGANEECAARLVNQYFHGRTYAFPVAVNMIVTTWIVIVMLTERGMPVLNGFGQNLVAVAKVPAPMIAGMAGAWLWGMYEMFTRYRTRDLTPESLHFLWLRAPVAGATGYILSLGLIPELAVFAGFVCGVFPLATLKKVLTAVAVKRLGWSLATREAEECSLPKLQGLSESVIERLAEEGIESVEHLACADPVKLLVRTNLEWKMILDIVDQALLYVYFGDAVLKLRPLGIRGAIELATLADKLEDPVWAAIAKQQVNAAGQCVGLQEGSMEYAVRTLKEDCYVAFLWSLLPDPEEEEPEEGVEP